MNEKATMTKHDVKLEDFLQGKNLTLSLKTGEAHTIEIRRKRLEMIEFADTLFRFNSGVLLPVETGPSSDGIPHPGLDVVAACLHYSEKHQDKTILDAGHTDTMGSDDSNVRLSRIRAEAVHGMMVGDRDEFANACWGPHLTQDQRYPNGGDGSKAGVLWYDYLQVA
jgi:hypothetical protein